MKPDLEYLALVDWRVWGTLTFKGEKSTRIKERMWFAHVRNWCSVVGARFSDCWWVRRSEFGELGGRHHFHYLIGGREFDGVTLGMCFAMQNRWQKLGGGWAHIREYDGPLGGLDYMLKALNGGLAYETSKLAYSNSELLLSKALFRSLRWRRVRDEQYLSGQRRVPTLFRRESGFVMNLGAVVPRNAIRGHVSESPVLAITGQGSPNPQSA